MKRLLSVAAVLMMVLMSMTASAQSSTSITQGIVQVTVAGEFSVYVCPFANNKTNFVHDFWNSPRNPQVTSSTGEDTVGRLVLCYIDSKPDRAAYTVSLSATDFHSITPGVNASISVQNLRMFRTQSISRNNFLASHVISPGEGTMYSVSDLGEHPARPEGGPDPNLSYSINQTLDQPRTVARADAGRGISVGVEDTSGQHIYTASQVIYMSLHVPAGTRPASYQTTITVTVNPGNP